MIAADTSSFVAYLCNDEGKDTALVDDAMENQYLAFPPVVLTELSSAASITDKQLTLLARVPILNIKNGFWLRAGRSRSTLLAKKLKARLADSLIAQMCIDHDIALITRDNDFRHFAKHCNLKLAI